MKTWIVSSLGCGNYWREETIWGNTVYDYLKPREFTRIKKSKIQNFFFVTVLPTVWMTFFKKIIDISKPWFVPSCIYQCSRFFGADVMKTMTVMCPGGCGVRRHKKITWKHSRKKIARRRRSNKPLKNNRKF